MLGDIKIMKRVRDPDLENAISEIIYHLVGAEAASKIVFGIVEGTVSLGSVITDLELCLLQDKNGESCNWKFRKLQTPLQAQTLILKTRRLGT